MWIEEYRPYDLSEMSLPSDMVEVFSSYIENQDITQHLIFYGIQGSGKTTLARILANHLSDNYTSLSINASEKTGIDTLRDEITDFINNVGLFESQHKKRIVILDEFDRLSLAAQDALKGMLEFYHDSCRFIMTTNHIEKISDRIKGRCCLWEFGGASFEKKEVKSEIIKSQLNILCKNIRK